MDHKHQLEMAKVEAQKTPRAINSKTQKYHGGKGWMASCIWVLGILKIQAIKNFNAWGARQQIFFWFWLRECWVWLCEYVGSAQMDVRTVGDA